MVDVATAAGVSLGTVSNVLNRPGLVAPATRARVEQAIERLGFVRNESARQLRAGASRALAYVMLDAKNPFFTDVAEGMEAAAEAAGLALFLCNSANRVDREDAYLARLREQRVQGVMVTPVDADRATLLAGAGDPSTPVVLVDRTPSTDADTCCAVAVDDVCGGMLGVEHLADLGHERIAFIGGPDSIGQVRDRLAGARQAWAAAGRPPWALTHLRTGGLTFAEGRAAGERLAGLPASRRPTAVFCANDLLALGVLQHATTTGRAVASDLAIVGYDDIDFAAAAAVPLTSVRQPRHELGRRAAELLIDESANPEHVHQRIVFTPELIARASTLG
ncbi:LacI family DNA-binding transcriptional regulator [Actinokineospora sp. 24-640]